MSERWADTLDEQKTYYDERAGEYDNFWFRRGSYALDEPLASQWAMDAATTMGEVERFADGDVLELACGTGIFTDVLRRRANIVDALDASPAMLALNAERTAGATNVTYAQADLFDWLPTRRYDRIFFGFWLSHVPDDLFETFWESVRGALAPGGEVLFVDSMPYRAKQGVVAPADSDTAVRTEQRTLDDGRTFRIVKRYWEPAALVERLSAAGWDARVEPSAHSLMLLGAAQPTPG